MSVQPSMGHLWRAARAGPTLFCVAPATVSRKKKWSGYAHLRWTAFPRALPHIYDNTTPGTLAQQRHSVLCRTTGHIIERKQAPNTHLQALPFAKRILGTALKTMLGGEPHYIAEDSVIYIALQQTLEKLCQPTQQASIFRGRVRSEGLRLINSGNEAHPPPRD
jgi:hypothetical protein